MGTVLILALAVLAAVFLRSGRPVWNLLLSAVGGGTAFWLSSAVSAITGVTLPFNPLTGLTALLLGAPGVGSLWLLQYLWQ